MNWLTKGLASSVGKKFVMGITGLMLCGFLVVHLAGNLLLYAGDDGDTYNGYSHALHSQEWFVNTAEVVLLALFVTHIWLAVLTTLENRAARQIEYARKRSKKDHGILLVSADTWMFVSGVVVLVFLLLHLSEFRFSFVLHDRVAGKEPFEKAQLILTHPLSSIVYLIGAVLLGFHLSHGFSSAFQSLGLNHPKYTPAIKCLGILFAVLVAVGFASFPVWAWATTPPM